jgi:hypothetical protein
VFELPGVVDAAPTPRDSCKGKITWVKVRSDFLHLLHESLTASCVQSAVRMPGSIRSLLHPRWGAAPWCACHICRAHRLSCCGKLCFSVCVGQHMQAVWIVGQAAINNRMLRREVLLLFCACRETCSSKLLFSLTAT